MVARGSSPLTRGKRLREDVGAGAVRLIPAHAGKTSSRTSGRRRPSAHPRSRGENIVSFSVTSRRRGSSPLTRGKYVTDVTRARRCGLIPAHAGKTRGWSVVPQASGAHPRSRGENSSRVNGKPALQGSSPLTRGKQTPWGEWAYALRLIPAHAGKTWTAWSRSWRGPAHPRSRGENSVIASP